MKKVKNLILGLIFLTFALSVSANAQFIDFVYIGDAGNSADPLTGYGVVDYDYYIGTYEVTNSQYTVFLNDVAASNTYSLYNNSMAGPEGGILRSGSEGSYTYSAKSGWEDKPVVWVSWYDAARFTNWMMIGSTEGTSNIGAYDTTNFGLPYHDDTPSHNTSATYWLPTEDEWYKAAYYDPTLNEGAGGYYLYPTKSNTAPNATTPTDAPNSANYNNVIGALTDVGAYSGSGSYYGTFDQAGNALEWTNDLFNGSNSGYRALRGGIFTTDASTMISTYRWENDPDYECKCRGFRLAVAPEPISSTLFIIGGATLGFRRFTRRKLA